MSTLSDSKYPKIQAISLSIGQTLVADKYPFEEFVDEQNQLWYQVKDEYGGIIKRINAAYVIEVLYVTPQQRRIQGVQSNPQIPM